MGILIMREYITSHKNNNMKLKLIIILGFIFNIGYSQLSNNRNYVYVKTYKNQVNESTTSTNDDEYNEVVTYIDGKGKNEQTILIKNGGNNEDVVFYKEYDNLNREIKQFLPYSKNINNGSYVDNINSLQESFYNTTKYENTLNPYKEIVYDEYKFFLAKEIAHPGNDWNINNSHTIKTNYIIYDEYSLEDTVYKYYVDFDSNNNPYLSNSSSIYEPKSLIKYVLKNENWIPTDNKNNTTETFKDLFGRIILKRVFNNDLPHDSYYVYDSLGNLIYMIPPEVDHSDLFDINNSEAPTYSETIENFCFQYKYDNKNRLIEKKIPGKGWQYIVYDKLNRPILTQDQNQRLNNKWSFIEYDVYGRIIYEGELIDSNALTRIEIENIISQLDTYVTFDVNAPLYYTHYLDQFNLSINVVNYYDNYNFDLDLIFVPDVNYYNEKITTLTKNLLTGKKIRTLDSQEWETNVFFYDKKERSIKIVSKNQTLETLNSVDYLLDFSGKVIETKTVHNKTNVTTALTKTDEFSYDRNDRLIKHQQYINNKPKEIISAHKYDELGKLIEKKIGGTTKLVLTGLVDNQGLITKTGLTDSWTNAYLKSTDEIVDSGKLSFKIRSTSGGHLRVGLSYNPSTVYTQIDYALNFSNNGTLGVYEGNSLKLSTTYSLNDFYEIEKMINGQVVYKKNGDIFYTSTNLSTGGLYADGYFLINNSAISNLSIENYDYADVAALQTIDYKYNIQGDLTKINDVNTLGNDLFALEIRRNNPTATGNALYNNNISQVFWRSANDNQLRYYDYSYDHLNRIKKAKFYNLNNSNQNDSFNLETVNYDKNGNITFLHRAGDKMNQPNLEWMDFMTYSYEGNKLTKVLEQGHRYFGHTTQIPADDTDDQYEYDQNGNVTKDRNKKISSISYNKFNLPTIIQFEDTSKSIEYIYNGTGTKLKKIIKDGSNITNTEYSGYYIYQKVNTNLPVLQFISHHEGYVSNDSGNLKYVYNYSDHLGNIRLTYTDANNDGLVNSTEIIKENNYYPFGMKHSGYNNVYNPIGGNSNFKFGFEGQELQDELGLDWIQFKWRNENPALGRFMGIDPLAEKYNYLTPYQFSSNQPIHAPELEGLESEFEIDGRNIECDWCDEQRENNEQREFEEGFAEWLILNFWPSGSSGGEEISEEVIDAVEDFFDTCGGDSAFDENNTGLGDYETDDFDFMDFIEDGLEGIKEMNSEMWNSPLGRFIIPDKISFSLGSSITAIVGVESSTTAHFIVRGHDARFTPYFTEDVGVNIGPDVGADASFSIEVAWFAVSNMNNLAPGKAKEALAGPAYNIGAEGAEGIGIGGHFNYGIDNLQSGEPNYITLGIDFLLGIKGGGVMSGQQSYLIE